MRRRIGARGMIRMSDESYVNKKEEDKYLKEENFIRTKATAILGPSYSTFNSYAGKTFKYAFNHR